MKTYEEMDLPDWPKTEKPDYIQYQIRKRFMEHWPELYNFLHEMQADKIEAHLWDCTGLMGG